MSRIIGNIIKLREPPKDLNTKFDLKGIKWPRVMT